MWGRMRSTLLAGWAVAASASGTAFVHAQTMDGAVASDSALEATEIRWQQPIAPTTPPPVASLQPSVVDGSTATDQPRPRTNPTRRSSSASQFALGGAASSVSRRQASTPFMIGDLFGASVYQFAFQGDPVKTTAVYYDATANTDVWDTFAFFNHTGGGTAGLPGISGLTIPIGQAMDTTGDGNLDTFPGLAPPPGLDQAILAAQGQPGTVIYVSGVGYFVREQLSPSGAPFLNPQTIINGQPRTAIDGNSGVPSIPSAYDLLYNYTFIPERVIVNVPSPGGGGAVGRIKIAENNSPIPRDRVFFNYSLFHNVPFDSRDPDVNRYTPGFEKTFWNGLGSVELRVPFASTLDSNMVTGALTNGSHTEFGNMTGLAKLLLWHNDQWAFAGGLGVSAPTADDVVVSTPNGRPLIAINNDAFHLLPYAAVLWTPNDRFFLQGFGQVDVDVDGNPVWADLQGQGLERMGRLQDATLLIGDLGVGYWIYRGNSGRVTGLAPVWELHYNRSVEDQDVIRQGNFVIGNVNRDVDVLNTTIGLNVELFNYALLTAGYTAPLSNETDRQFDGEFRIMCNIGPRPTRAARAQF